MENLQLALMLLSTGMITVFLILILVIVLGKYLILFVNKYIPEEIQEKATTRTSFEQQAVIEEVIKTITHGKGIVKSIEKI